MLNRELRAIYFRIWFFVVGYVIFRSKVGDFFVGDNRSYKQLALVSNSCFFFFITREKVNFLEWDDIFSCLWYRTNITKFRPLCGSAVFEYSICVYVLYIHIQKDNVKAQVSYFIFDIPNIICTWVEIEFSSCKRYRLFFHIMPLECNIFVFSIIILLSNQTYSGVNCEHSYFNFTVPWKYETYHLKKLDWFCPKTTAT